jgi:mRNA interferase RelE/StbE
LAWKIRFSDAALRQLGKLDSAVRRRISDFLEHRVAMLDNPRRLGTALSGELKGLWRYRVGDYRILCRIQDQELVVVVITVGHRRDVYE